MFLSGHKRKKEDWAELDGIVLNIRQDELEQLIEFLQSVRKEIAHLPADTEEHWHYRDYSDLWSEGQPDLILYVEPGLNAATE